MAPNPSIERTSPGEPGLASHVKRWASSFVGLQTVVASNSFCVLPASASPVLSHGLTREVQASCPSVGGQRTGGSWPAGCRGGLGGSQVRRLVVVSRIGHPLPNPSFQRTAFGGR